MAAKKNLNLTKENLDWIGCEYRDKYILDIPLSPTLKKANNEAPKWIWGTQKAYFGSKSCNFKKTLVV